MGKFKNELFLSRADKQALASLRRAQAISTTEGRPGPGMAESLALSRWWSCGRLLGIIDNMLAAHDQTMESSKTHVDLLIKKEEGLRTQLRNKDGIILDQREKLITARSRYLKVENLIKQAREMLGADREMDR